MDREHGIRICPACLFFVLVLIFFTAAASEGMYPGRESSSLHSQTCLTSVIDPDLPVQSGLHSLSSPGSTLFPEDLEYLGAFRVPVPESEVYGWLYGGGGLSYYPAGDPGGARDGYPGSLFGMGHDQRNYVTEISIPVPVISPGKNCDDLNSAETLQPFADINAGIFTDTGQGAPLRGDVCYIPARMYQSSDQLYFSFAEHLQFTLVPSLARCTLDLSAPASQGPWTVGSFSNFCIGDYLFEIPDSWAALHLPGYHLAGGRFRDGSLSGSGPTLIAMAPWLDGDPPAAGSQLAHVSELLMYEKGYEGSSHVMINYTNADEWSGGAWLTSEGKSAVVFAGTRGRGECWYGFADGTVWPDEPPYPPIPPPPNNERGWWAEQFEGVLLFYDPGDIARVVSGEIPAYQPQPYAVMPIDSFLFGVHSNQQKRHVGDITFDRTRGFLYISEFRGDGEACLIHVWKISPASPTLSRIGVWRPSTHQWFLDWSGNGAFGAGDVTYTFGATGDIPVTGDWNGNGRTEIGVWRLLSHHWFLDWSGNGVYGTGDVTYTLGANGDLPVTGDWNGNGRTEIGVWRPTTRQWFLDWSGNGAYGTGDVTYTFGAAGDMPVTGDWNGNGRTEIGVWRPTTRQWLLDWSGNGAYGAGDVTYTLGATGDKPVTGDWNGNGRTEIAVWRPSTHQWFLDWSGNGAFGTGDVTYTLGANGDTPVTGAWSGSSGSASITSVDLIDTVKPAPDVRLPGVSVPVADIPRVEMPVKSSTVVSPANTGGSPANQNPLSAGGGVKIPEV